MGRLRRPDTRVREHLPFLHEDSSAYQEHSRHPLSVDALCALPPELPNVDAASTILTGSSDGYVRAVQILPTKLLGVVADHGEWPIERISVGGGHDQLSIDREQIVSDRDNFVGTRGNSKGSDEDEDNIHPRRWWVGSVGHEDVLRLTDLEGFFHDNELNEDGKGSLGVDISEEESDAEGSGVDQGPGAEGALDLPAPAASFIADPDQESSSEEDEQRPPVELEPKKRKRKPESDSALPTKKKKGKNAVVVERSFFDDL